MNRVSIVLQREFFLDISLIALSLDLESGPFDNVGDFRASLSQRTIGLQSHSPRRSADEELEWRRTPGPVKIIMCLAAHVKNLLDRRVFRQSSRCFSSALFQRVERLI